MTAATDNGKTTAAPDAFVLSADDLTLKDCMDLEELTGVPAFETFNGAAAGKMRAKEMAALVYITKRKTDPTFTFEAACEMKVSALSQGESSAQ